MFCKCLHSYKRIICSQPFSRLFSNYPRFLNCFLSFKRESARGESKCRRRRELIDSCGITRARAGEGKISVPLYRSRHCSQRERERDECLDPSACLSPLKWLTDNGTAQGARGKAEAEL